MAMASPLRSPLRDPENPIPPPLPQPSPEKPPYPSPPAILNRSTRDDLAVVTKVEDGGGGGVSVENGGGGEERGSGVVSGIVRRSRRAGAVRKAAIGVRVLAMVFSLISFSVMASDKTQGWAGDSFDRYKEYRYCLSMNVITFVYSGFQLYAQAHHMITGKHIIRRPIGYYLDFSMDQILAYLLISASSSAATRNNDWVSDWGRDPFTDVASGSIAMSFLTFMALALSSFISAYNLFGRIS